MYPQDIKAVPLPKAEGIGGFNDLRNISALQVGTGARSFKADQDGIFLGGNTFATAPFRVNMAGAVVASSLTLTNAVIIDPTITGIQTGSEIAIQGWQHDLVFSVTDLDTVAWASGTITLMNGDTYSISAGNTGNMAAETFVYLDIATSITVLQVTTTKTTAVGTGKIMVAIAKNGTVEPTFFVFASDNKNLNATDIVAQSILAANIGNNVITASQILANTITASEIAANTITAAEIAAVTITAAQIVANTITANEIAANTVTASEIAAGTITTTQILAGGVSADRLAAGTISSKAITLAITAGTGDSYIAAGKTDFTNTDNGFILGLDDSDADKPKFYIGGSSNYLNWDGSALTIRGVLDASDIVAGTITGRQYRTAASGNRVTIDDAITGSFDGIAFDGTDASTVYLYNDNSGHLQIDGGDLYCNGNIRTYNQLIAEVGDLALNPQTTSFKVNMGGNVDMQEYDIDACDVVWANSFSERSDKRLKQNIKSRRDNLAQILKLRPVNFKFKKDKIKRIGLIAQEIEKILPDLVKTDDMGIKGITYNGLIPVLIGAIQELQARVVFLEAKIA